MYVEKARLLAGSAQLALVRGESDEAYRLAEEALAFAEEKKMRNMYPLTNLTMGKVLANQGYSDRALGYFNTAEAEAIKLNMRPLIRQSRLEAAAVLEQEGRQVEAEEKRANAQAMAEEIANLINDQELRSAYRQSTFNKVGAG